MKQGRCLYGILICCFVHIVIAWKVPLQAAYGGKGRAAPSVERGEQRVRASSSTFETHALKQAVLEAAGASKTCRVTRRAAFFFTCAWLVASRPTSAHAARVAENEFTLSFNASKGALGVRLQELRYPRKSGFFGGKTFEVVIVSSVDPSGQAVLQTQGQVRPGLVVKRVQGRKLSGVPSKQVIRQIEDEVRKEGLPELVEITFSTECVAMSSEPDVCYNSVMPIDSVLGYRKPEEKNE